MEAIIKPEVQQLTPYTLREFPFRHKLNQNENPFGFPAELKEEFWRRVRDRDWARYPDFYLRQITERLAAKTGVSEDMVLVGNGSNELIQLTLMVTVTREDTVTVPVPTFTLYRLLATVLGAEAVTVLLGEGDFALPAGEVIATARRRGSKIVVLCTPNNPTGNTYPEAAVRQIIEECGALVVIDQAYGEFCDQDLTPLLSEFDNVVFLRTFSKALALAGARLGYLLGPPALVREIAKAKLPYALNIFSETAALVALDHLDVLESQVAKIRHQRARLFAGLSALGGAHPYPSEANFILARFARPSTDIFAACLADGLLVRDVSSYPGLDGHLRLSVGTAEENELLLSTIRSSLSET